VEYRGKEIIDTNICIKPMVTATHHQLLRLHKHYKNGLLPLSGGVLDQPNIYLEAMELIDGVLSDGNAS
jgi:hypothetical protein